MDKIEITIPEGYVKSAESTDTKIILVPAKSDDVIIEEFFLSIFNRMRVRVERERPNSVFYDIERGTVFEQDFKGNRLFVAYPCIYTPFYAKCQIDMPQVREYIMVAIEKYLKWKGFKIVFVAIFNRSMDAVPYSNQE